MSFIITNRAKQLTIVPLNSGKSIHLGPGESSAAIEDYEVNGNAKVEKLRDSGVVALDRQ